MKSAMNLSIALCLLFAGIVGAKDSYVWVEAESGKEKVEHTNDWWTPVDKAILP